MKMMILMMDYDEDVDEDVGDDADKDVYEDDLIAAAGSTTSRPLKILPGPRKCSPQLHYLSNLLLIISSC